MTMTEPFTQRDLTALHARVRRSATSRYLTPSDVEDITAEVLLAAARTAPRDGVSVFAAAVANTKRARYVGRKVKDATPYATSYRFGVAARFDDLNSDEYDATFLYKSGHFAPESSAAQEIRDLVRRLPLGQAQAFTLCGEFHYTLEEAAAMLGVSRSTVDRNLKRARASLQQSMLTT